MSWNYDWSNLANSEKDQIRNEIGDVDPGDPQLQDEEIEYNISVERDFWSAAARCCEQIARIRLRKVDVRLGRALQVQYSKSAQQYFEMAKELRRKALGSVAPYAGGIYVADKIAMMTDDSLVAPAFARIMQENPWVGGYTADIGPPISNAAPDDSAA